MPFTTFVPPILPKTGQRKPVISLNTAEFGDGYTQSSPKGINHIRQMVDVKWEGLVLSEKNTIEAFFIAQKGCIPFIYQFHGQTAALNWICKDWSISAGPPWNISAKFEQSFIIG